MNDNATTAGDSPREREAVLTISGVSKHHGPTAALRDVSLTVRRGSVHGLIGGNGAGKSSLVKILAGVSQADSGGSIEVDGRRVDADRISSGWSAAAGLRFVHQDLGVFDDMTLAENLAIARGYDHPGVRPIRWRDIRSRVVPVLERFGVTAHPDRSLGDLSAPDRTLVAIARALQEEEQSGKVLVLDEPTACLPAAEADRLLATVRRLADDDGYAIVLISHRLDEVARTADTVSVLRDGALVRTLGGGEITEPAMVGLLAGASGEASSPEPYSAADRADTPVLRVDGLCGGQLSDVSFDVMPGEVLGIAGLLGSGRSRLLRSLYGLAPLTAGEIHVDGRPVRIDGVPAAIRAGFAYVPEDRAGEGVFADMPLGDNLTANRLNRYWAWPAVKGRAEARDVARMISRYVIRARSGAQPMGTLSGGNQQKAVMAHALEGAPRVLLLDEPSQGVDVSARAEIHRIVRTAVDAGAAAIVVSSDFEELSAISDRVLALNKGRVTGELGPGDIAAARLHQLAFRSVKEEKV
ncbi:sugar ABC transporter ATP-binding protein [Yinghuangia aomiensis]|uniref:Sugar ABC transporter ATP-binding protein n=2 Tax=Yinghuangia aomiensis TaxID=676205 RepID=A0ABP9HUI3_9ACTN